MKFYNHRLFLFLSALIFSLLACRPIIAIGWTEIIIIFVLVAILLGPLMFRLYRFIDKVRKVSQEDEKKKK
jgi:hypothetical protein